MLKLLAISIYDLLIYNLFYDYSFLALFSISTKYEIKGWFTPWPNLRTIGILRYLTLLDVTIESESPKQKLILTICMV